MADSTRRQANNSNNIILQLVEEENPATTSIRNNSMILEKYIGKEREQNQCFSPCLILLPCTRAPEEQTRSEASSNSETLLVHRGWYPRHHNSKLQGCLGDTWAVLGYPILFPSSHTPPGFLLFWNSISFWSSQTSQSIVDSGVAFESILGWNPDSAIC